MTQYTGNDVFLWYGKSCICFCLQTKQTIHIYIYRDIPIQRVFSSVSMDKNTSLSKREYFNLFCQT